MYKKLHLTCFSNSGVKKGLNRRRFSPRACDECLDDLARDVSRKSGLSPKTGKEPILKKAIKEQACVSFILSLAK